MIRAKLESSAAKKVHHTIALPIQRSAWRPSVIIGVGAAGGVLIALIGSVGFLGWVFGIPAMKTIATGLASMKVNTALGLIFGGLAIAVAGLAPDKRRLYFALAAVPVLLGAVSLAEYISGADLRIDQILFADPDSKIWPGRMSISTAVNMVLLGLGAMIVLSEQPVLRYAAEFIKLAGLLHALFALLGYLYNVSSFYSVLPYSTVALHTAIAFCVSFAALFCLRPSVGLAGIVAAENAGGILARRLLASAVIAPVMIGLLVVRGLQAQGYNADFALAVFTVANILVFAALILHTAREIGRLDQVRISALDELLYANDQMRKAFAENEALLAELHKKEERSLVRRSPLEKTVQQDRSG